MQKLKLMLIPTCIGGVLLFFSWYTSYPVSLDSPYDFVYNHISPLNWIGLTILFASLFIVAMFTKNNVLRWAVAVATVFLMYSESYFYYSIPGSDSHLFRGLTEDFIATGDLSLEPFHSYYQWPLFFILNKIATLTMGLGLRGFEFVLHFVIGFLLTTSIYLYASKARANGYVAVIAFFIILRFFFNYQWAPFSLAISLLLILFVLDSSLPQKRESSLLMLVIFFCLTFTHAFVPSFFVIYTLMMYVIKKTQGYLRLFVATFAIYLTVLMFQTSLFFPRLVRELMTTFFVQEYVGQFEAITARGVIPVPYVDTIAQLFSRTVVVVTAVITGVGFLILLIRRGHPNLRSNDHGIFLTGLLYAAIGLFLPILGTRAFFAVAIPVSLGASYFTQHKFKRFFKTLFLVLIILFTFVLIHRSFYAEEVQFQTKEEYICANFVIGNYDWENSSRLLSHFRVMRYLQVRSSSKAVLFKGDNFPSDFVLDISDYDCIVYTVGLARSFLRLNNSIEPSLSEFEINHFSLIYNSGDFFYVFLK